MKIIQTLMLSLCILGFAFTSQAQLSQKSNDDKLAKSDKLPDNNGRIDWNRVFFGFHDFGGISTNNYGFGNGIFIGNGGINVGISPHIGYYFTDSFSAGIGPTFQLSKFDADNLRYLGGHAFARYDVLRILFLQTEVDYVNFKRKFDGIQIGDAKNFPAVLAGGGINITPNSRMVASGLILYNFTTNQADEQFYPYRGVFGGSNPIVRINLGYRL